MKEISKEILEGILLEDSMDLNPVTIVSTINHIQRIVAEAKDLVKNVSNYRPNETNVIELTENVVTSMSHLTQPKVVGEWLALEKVI